MRNLFKALAIALFVFGIANCGGKGGGGESSSPTKPQSGIADGATEIQFLGEGPVISWNNDINNIFRPHSNPKCINGLSEENADDDELVAEKLNALEALLKVSVVSKGKQDISSDESRLLTVSYSDGTSRTFNLDTNLASSDEEVLSNGAQIINFYEELKSQLDKVSCPGKGDINND